MSMMSSPMDSSTPDPNKGSYGRVESPSCDTPIIPDHDYCYAGTSQNASLPPIPAQPSSRPAYGGSYCCVVGCRNSTYNKKSGMIKFHKFPANSTRRDQWEKAVRRSVPGKHALWRASKTAVICSEHFAFGKKTDEEDSPGYIPSHFPTHCVKLQTEAQKKRGERLKKFQQMRQLNCMDPRDFEVHKIKPEERRKGSRNQDDTCQEEEGCQEEEEDEDCQEVEEDEDCQEVEEDEDCQEVEEDEDCQEVEEDEDCQEVEEDEDCQEAEEDCQKVEEEEECQDEEKDGQDKLRIFLDYGIQCGLPSISLKTPMKIQAFYIGYVECGTEKSTQIESSVMPVNSKVKVKFVQTEKQHVLPFENFTDRQFKAFTGVEKNFVSFLSHRVHSKVKKTGHSLSLNMKITLLLVKLKINATFGVLAAMFGVCEDTAIKIYYEILDIVAEEARNNIIWFDHSTIRTRMPKSFKEHFDNTRAIIDCTEIETEMPSDVRENVLSYSHYKSRHTLKVLIAIAPSGEITFLSKAFGGRCSDTEITVASGFLKLIQPGDIILADKGFPSIQTNINTAGGILVMPPFKKGSKQFSEVQNQAGYQCSSLRIHVERAIQRLKRFEALTFVPASARKNVDKILQIVAFITNCYTDLINDD